MARMEGFGVEKRLGPNVADMERGWMLVDTPALTRCSWGTGPAPTVKSLVERKKFSCKHG